MAMGNQMQISVSLKQDDVLQLVSVLRHQQHSKVTNHRSVWKI